MISYQELIQGSTFEESLNGPGGSIPRKAHHLADRLSRAVDALFVDTEGNDPNSWGQTRCVSENRQGHLVEIFTTALKFKAETVTTDCRYEFVIHPVKTAVLGAHTDGRSGCIQFWKYATIHVYQGEASMPADQFVDALVNSRNFITKDEDAPWIRCRYSKDILVQKPDPLPVQDDHFRANWASNGNGSADGRDAAVQTLENNQLSLPGQTSTDAGEGEMGTASTIAQVAITCRQCSAVFSKISNRNAHERNGAFIDYRVEGRGADCLPRILSDLY